MEIKRLLTRKGLVGKGLSKRTAPRRKTFYLLVKGKFEMFLEFTPYRGYCYRSIRHLAGDRLDLLATLPPPEFSMKRIKLGQNGGESAAKHLAAVETNLFTSLPSLVAHCCLTRYDDGEPRQVGWVSIQTRGAAWIVTVKDPDAGAKLNATANSLDDALCLAELLLSSEEAPWEPDPFLMSQSKKKKKSA